VRLTYPRSMRLSIQMDDNRPILTVVHSVLNSRRTHMGIPEEYESDTEEDEVSQHKVGEEEVEDEEEEEDEEDCSTSANCLQFPGSYGGVFSYLMETHPKWFTLKEIPLTVGMTKQELVALLMSLWWAGLLETRAGNVQN